jgi:D-glycero-D-manno-heptose 1,7-bisphosphate phosphatase
MNTQKALFLDRDGVINSDVNYAYKIDQIVFIDGIFNLCKAAKDAGYLIIIVTNQAGIGRGLYSENDFHKLMKWMLKIFKNHSIIIDDIFYCPHHEDATILRYKKSCQNRKPAPGMILDAAKKHNILLEDSILVGNNISDINAGIEAGVGNLSLLNSQEIESDTYQKANDLLTIKDWYFGKGRVSILR